MIIFSKERAPPSPQLMLYGDPIPICSELKFLGFLFDNRLSRIPHIRNLKSKCLRIINILKYLSSPNYGCSMKKRLLHEKPLASIQNLHPAVTRLWVPTLTPNKVVLGVLDTIQSTAHRLATETFRTSPTLSLCAETSTMPLHCHRIKLTVNLLLSIAQNPFLPSFNLLFKSYAKLHHALSDALPVLPRHPLHFPLQTIFSEPPPRILLDFFPNVRFNILKYTKSSDTSINSHLNLILSEFPQLTKCFTDGSKTHDKSA